MDLSKKNGKLNRTKSVYDKPIHYEMNTFNGSGVSGNTSSSKIREDIIISPLSIRTKDSSPTRTIVAYSVYGSSGPGPGRHSRPISTIDDITLIRSPAYSIGKANRKYLDEYGPASYQAGPASYSCNSESVKPRPPTCAIGRESRKLGRQSRVGPASYEAGPSTYSPERHHSPMHRLMPSFSFGPGKYARSSSIGHVNHDPILFKSPAYTIAKASRDQNHHIFVGPGPASYNYDKPVKKKMPSFSIGKAERFLNYAV